jgi:phosphate starvation-inducible PhoH-like protein
LITEKKLSIKGVEPVLIFGVHDVHLNRIEEEFEEVQIMARGNTLTLRGSIDQVRQVENVFTELIFLINQNGELLPHDIETVIKLSNADTESSYEKQRPSEKPENDVIITTKNEPVRARTPGQRRMVAESKKNDIVFAIGPAGTGKTYTAVAIAVSYMKRKDISKIVLARPAVEAGESLGFLPGDLAQKIDPYLRPLYDALQDMLTAEKLKAYLERKTIEIVPLAYMRGRTLNNAFIILDEAQNATNMQMKMCLTRLGINSKAIITGDVTQIDLPKKNDSGLIQAKSLLENVKGIGFVYLDKIDVVRHKLVRDIIDAYDKNKQKNNSENEL